MKTIKDAFQQFTNGQNPLTEKAEEVQYIVRENKKKPGEPIFVREDGKVGFPTINSVGINIGDVVRGKIQYEEPNYFLLEVREIIK
jgi:hypothetical protein